MSKLSVGGIYVVKNFSLPMFSTCASDDTEPCAFIELGDVVTCLGFDTFRGPTPREDVLNARFITSSGHVGWVAIKIVNSIETSMKGIYQDYTYNELLQVEEIATK